MTSRLKAAVDRALRSGFQISPEALEYLEGQRDPYAVLDSALRAFESDAVPPLVIDRLHLETVARLDVMEENRGSSETSEQRASEQGSGLGEKGTIRPTLPSSCRSSTSSASSFRPSPPPPLSPVSCATLSSLATETLPGLSSRHLKAEANAAGGEVRVVSGTEMVTIRGKAVDFRDYFRDRFSAISSILKSRADVNGASSASNVPDGAKWHKVKVIGMVNSKREYRDGSVSVELEDTEGSVKVTFRGNDSLKRKASRLLVDEVVCIVGVTRDGRSVIAEDVIWPDIPYMAKERKPGSPVGSSEHIYAVLTSDIHIGSKTFLKDDFERFLGWLRGESDDVKLKEMALRTKYLVIAGDLVDGVGIYPNQEEELDIQDIYEQYRVAAEYLSTLPERIRIVIIPGNHDACRPTLPTPPIYSDYAAPLYAMSNVLMLGDPSVVELSGTTFLVTHGRSLDDVIPLLPDCNFREPQKAMVELLKSRHIAPVYGEKTPLAPEPKDRLVIDRVPDIFLAGHVHVEGVADYRGVLVINSGTWQSQTKYQLSAGIVPKPSVVPVVDLNAMRAYELNFS
ncbi:MAG: DNA-directed DNA polymerase II small subunit [Candidatus Verstraetearchaeota archaeon]|nr:DNA-directed DNA polymerase II small subunit [Candidatus Verstraetearchaeota archaeon]